MPARTLLGDHPVHFQPWAEDAHAAVVVADASKATSEDGGLPRRDDSSRLHAFDLPTELLPTSLVVAEREGTVVSHAEDSAYHVGGRVFGQEEMVGDDGDRLACLDSRHLQGACAP